MDASIGKWSRRMYIQKCIFVSLSHICLYNWWGCFDNETSVVLWVCKDHRDFFVNTLHMYKSKARTTNGWYLNLQMKQSCVFPAFGRIKPSPLSTCSRTDWLVVRLIDKVMRTFCQWYNNLRVTYNFVITEITYMYQYKSKTGCHPCHYQHALRPIGCKSWVD